MGNSTQGDNIENERKYSGCLSKFPLKADSNNRGTYSSLLILLFENEFKHHELKLEVKNSYLWSVLSALVVLEDQAVM